MNGTTAGHGSFPFKGMGQQLSPGQMRRRFLCRQVQSGGLTRFYMLYIPTTLQRSQSVPLLLAFHGGGSRPRSLVATQLHHLAEKERFIIAYPAGTGRKRGRGLTWNAGGEAPNDWAEHNQIDDVGFVGAVIEDLARAYPLNRNRIYAIGISKGGMFAYHLACKMSDTIAAIAVIAGTLTSKTCEPKHPVAVLHIHGTDDQNVPLNGGRGRLTARGNSWPPVEDGLALWRQRNSCTTEPSITFRDENVTCLRYKSAQNADIEVCLIEDGGHAWPGIRPSLLLRIINYLLSIKVNERFPANLYAWRFFLRHPKRRTTPY